METASYNVTVTDSSENIVFASSRKTQTSITISVQAGTYYVYVEALNSDGIVIGTGTASCGVVAGQTNSFSITVSESYGEGIFAISIKANFLPQIVVYFYRADGTLVRRETPPYVDGKYESSFRIHNGFYSFAVVRADTEQVLHRDTVRIIKDTTATYSAECIILNDGTISIINEMQETPVISITLDKSVYDNTETLNASAVIEGITGNSFYWTVDGVIQGTTDSYKDLSLSLSEMDEGNHEIALFVSDGTVVWAENASFTIGGCFNIGYIDPDFDPENTTWYVRKADGDSFEIRMNNDGSAYVYYPSILDTYFRSMYGWFPTSGTPFHFYYQDQLGMSKAEFVSALVERSVDLPYPNYVPHVSHPYIETNIPDGLTITDVQTIFTDDKGYYRELESGNTFDFPETDSIYVGVSRYRSGNSLAMILVPEEVISVYSEKYPDKSWHEMLAAYFWEQYNCMNVLDDNGYFYFSRDQILTIISEYKSPYLIPGVPLFDSDNAIEVTECESVYGNYYEARMTVSSDNSVMSFTWEHPDTTQNYRIEITSSAPEEVQIDSALYQDNYGQTGADIFGGEIKIVEPNRFSSNIIYATMSVRNATEITTPFDVVYRFVPIGQDDGFDGWINFGVEEGETRTLNELLAADAINTVYDFKNQWSGSYSDWPYNPYI